MADFLNSFKARLARKALNYLQSGKRTHNGQEVRIDPYLKDNFERLQKLDFQV